MCAMIERLYSPRRSGFYPRPFHVRSMVDKLRVGQTFLRVLGDFAVSSIPPVLLIHISSNTDAA